MIDKIKSLKDSIKMLRELQENSESMDINKMMSSMGIDMDELNEQFESSFDKTITLEYTYKSVNPEPSYAYQTDSGFDLRANEKLNFAGFERKLVSTGLFVNIPEGYEIQVRPKSGLAINKGLSVLNTPGTVDQGYTGEIKVIVINMSNLPQTIDVGDKIAQAVLCPVVAGKYVNLKRVLNVDEKDRGDKGFGSTGN
jgi:dUTP pyrophosphatase